MHTYFAIEPLLDQTNKTNQIVDDYIFNLETKYLDYVKKIVCVDSRIKRAC